MNIILKLILFWISIFSLVYLTKNESMAYIADAAESMETISDYSKEVTARLVESRQKPNSRSPVVFRLYRGMKYSPAPLENNKYPGWERIVVNGSYYWIEKCEATAASNKEDTAYGLPYKIQIDKSSRKLKLMKKTLSGWKILRKYRIALGEKCDIRPKKRKGDGLTPSGIYYICKINPSSSYGEDPETGEPLASLMISYPNQYDAWNALQTGRIDIKTYNSVCEAIDAGKAPPQDTPLGSYLMLHGGGSDEDWTLGCIALDDEDMINLLKYAKIGMAVEIVL